MNVLEASNILFRWFADHDTLDLDRDFDKLLPESKNADDEEAALILALGRMEEHGYIGKCPRTVREKTRNTWVMIKPFESYSQQVAISGELALMLASMVNDFCDAIKDNEQKCNPLELTEADINMLVTICSVLAGRLKQSENPEKEEEEEDTDNEENKDKDE